MIDILLNQEAIGNQDSPSQNASELTKTYVEMWFQDILNNASTQYKHVALVLIVIVASVLVFIIQYGNSSNYNPLIILDLETGLPSWFKTVIGYLLSVFFTCVGAVIAFNYINQLLGFRSSPVLTKQQRLSTQQL